MAKLKLGIGADAANVQATEGRANYTGPTPPAGLYPARITSFKLGESKTKKPMFTAVLSLEAPKGDPRSEYNGYPIFHRLVVPEDKTYEYYDLQVGQINRLIDAMAGDAFKAARQALWGDNAVVDETGKLIKIGPINMKAKGGIFVLADTRARTYKRAVLEGGKPKKDDKGKVVTEVVATLEINDVLAPKKIDAEGDVDPEENIEYDEDEDDVVEETTTEPDVDEDEDDDADEAVEDDDSEDEEESEADDDDDDDVIAEEVPEEEPEPAPPARRSRRKAF